MDKLKPLVIVLSRNYSTGLGVIRALGAAGYTVDLLASVKKKGSSVIASSSKYIRNSVEVVTPKIQGDTGKEIIKELMKYAEVSDKKIVLFPVDDFTTSVVDLNRDSLQPYFLMPGIAESQDMSINQIMNKTFQGEVARQSGFLTPKEWLISLKQELIIPENMCYPCFVKPLQSISGHKTEMAVCKDAEELKGHLEGMQKFYKDRSVLIQEYLNIDKEYDLSGVCVDEQVIIPAVIEKTRIAKHELGVTMTGKLLPTDVIGEVKDKIVDLLKRIHYVGMFDMELILCGDKFYFNEINFRSGGPNYSYYLNGVNLPEIFVKEITGAGHDPEEEMMQEFGKTFVYEKVAWEDYMNSYMTKQELKRCIKSADFTLLEDKTDPQPGRIFYRRIRLSALKHKIKSRIHRSSISDKGATDVVKPKVVVTGRNYCNILTMTRALGEAGYEVEVLRIFKKKPNRMNLLAKMEPDAYSKYVKGFHRCVVDGNTGKVVSDLLGLTEGEQRKLLIPVDDYSACVVDEALNELSHKYIAPNVRDTEGEISRLMDKNVQKKLAEKYELPMLHSVLIKSENGHFEIPQDVHFPCFIKPNVSMNSTKSKMARCNNRKELETLLSKYAQIEDFEMLVEEYVDIKSEYSVLGLSTRDAAIAPAVFKVIEGGHKERKGVTITGEVVSDFAFQDIIEKCCKYIESLNYTGLFDVDLLETADGRIYFIELNFRAGASTHLFTKTGINLPGMFADYLVKNKPVNGDDVVKNVGKRFVSEKVLLEEFARSDADLLKVKKLMDEADVYFIKDELDPQPYRYFRKFYFVAMLMKIPYWIRDNKRK